MFMVHWLANRCRTIQAETEKNPCKGPGLEKRIPVRLCGLIFKAYLTNQECCRMSATCRTFQTHLCADGFGLLAGKCQTVFIRNASPFADSGSLKLKLGTPLPFTSFAYDPQGPLLLTGDASDYSFDSGVRVWDRNGKMVKQLTKSQLDKSACTVHLSVPDNRACCVGSEGRLRIWNLKTGKTLCDQPLLKERNPICLNLQTMTMVSSWRNWSYFWKIDELGECHKYKTKEAHASINWMCEAPEINRIFGLSLGEGALYVWDRTTLELLHFHMAGKVVYDAPSQQLFCSNGSKVEVLDPITGKQISVLQDAADNQESYSAFHYDCTNRRLFASCDYILEREVSVRSGMFSWRRNEMVPERKGKVVVWDLATSKVLSTFPYMPLGIRQIDFDPKTKTLLLANGNSVQLWDVASRRRIREFAGIHTEFRWDKQNKLIVLFRDYEGEDKEDLPIGGTLSLLDYSSALPKPESKQESKEKQ